MRRPVLHLHNPNTAPQGALFVHVYRAAARTPGPTAPIPQTYYHLRWRLRRVPSQWERVLWALREKLCVK